MRGEHLPVVVVTSYISPAVGQELRKREVYYLDTAGNAFLKATHPTLFILIQGQRQPLEARPDKGRAFRQAGLRLLYHLLNEPELLQAPYRVLADKASLSLGSVSAVLHDLRQQGLLREEGDKRRWLDAPQVVRRWVEGYGEVLKPKLGRQRYRWLTPDLGRGGWQQVPVGIDCFWGGGARRQPAARWLPAAGSIYAVQLGDAGRADAALPTRARCAGPGGSAGPV